MHSPLIAGVLVGALGDALAIGAGLTGLLTAGTRYYVVLSIRDDELTPRHELAVDRATGLGFFFGVALSLVIITIDLLT